jgi:alanine dehydrogenase
VVDRSLPQDPDELIFRREKMEKKNVFEKLVEISPGMEIWWDSSPVLFGNATLPYAVEIGNKGWENASLENPGIASGLNIVKGKVICRGVAEAFDLEYSSLDSVL